MKLIKQLNLLEKIFLLVSLICSILIILIVLTAPYFSIDLSVSHAVQAFNPPWFDLIMKQVSLPGDGTNFLVIVAIGSAVLYINKLKGESIFLYLITVCVFVLTTILKALINRARPSPELVNVFLQLNDGGFPSGHVLQYTALFGFLAYLIYRQLPYSTHRLFLMILMTLFTLLVSLIGLSRIYLGAHYLTDVLGGYVLGSLFLATIIKVYTWKRLSPSPKPRPSPRL